MEDLKQILNRVYANTDSKKWKDLDDIAAHIEELKGMAYGDVTTGLKNRRFFDETLEKEVSRAHRAEGKLSLILLDIDHFKKFNDSYGHKAGDYVLGCIGGIIKASLRTGDTPCRYGGEEVGVILPDTDENGAYRAAEKIRKNVAAATLKYDSGNLGNVNVSLGIAGYGGGDVDTFVKRADSALYLAKERGRNRTVVSEN